MKWNNLITYIMLVHVKMFASGLTVTAFLKQHEIVADPLTRSISFKQPLQIPW